MKINLNAAGFVDPKTFSVSKYKDRVEPTNFKQVIFDAINTVEQTEKKAINMDNQLALGNMENIHDMRIATMKADLTLNFAIALQKKLLTAYKEIMRIQF